MAGIKRVWTPGMTMAEFRTAQSRAAAASSAASQRRAYWALKQSLTTTEGDTKP